MLMKIWKFAFVFCLPLFNSAHAADDTSFKGPSKGFFKQYIDPSESEEETYISGEGSQEIIDNESFYEPNEDLEDIYSDVENEFFLGEESEEITGDESFYESCDDSSEEPVEQLYSDGEDS